MDQYTGIEIIEELKEIVKEWRAKEERRSARRLMSQAPEQSIKYQQGQGVYWRETSMAISVCTDEIEELIAKYDVK